MKTELEIINKSKKDKKSKSLKKDKTLSGGVDTDKYSESSVIIV